MTTDEALAGFDAGRTLVVDRRDEPLLPWLYEQVQAGTLMMEVVQYDVQSTAVKFRRAR